MSTNHVVLIVDDDPGFRKVIYGILQDKGYIPIGVATGKAALDRVVDGMLSVALIDLRLEDMSGLEVMGEIKKRSPSTQCILLTGYASQTSAIEAVNLGAYSYLQKPYDIDQLLVTIRRAVEKREAEKALQESEERYRDLVEKAGIAIIMDDREGRFRYFNETFGEWFGYSTEELKQRSIQTLVHPDDVDRVMEYHIGRTQGKDVPSRYEFRGVGKHGSIRCLEVDAVVLREGDEIIGTSSYLWDITERKRVEKELQQSFKKLRKALDDTIHTLTSVIEMRDPYTAGHQRQVAELACAIAKDMNLSEDQLEGIRMAGLIHDLGKISIPAEVLSKPGRLNELEWGLIKAHPQIGYDILKTVEFPWPVAQIVLQHHERIDSSGYPQGLSGEEIMLEARILAVADVVDAMASHRPYRESRCLGEVLEEISRNRGILYDTGVVDACLKLFTKKGFEFE